MGLENKQTAVNFFECLQQNQQKQNIKTTKGHGTNDGVNQRCD